MNHQAIILHKDGMSVKDIAKHVKLSVGRIYQIFRENNYKPQKVRPYKGQKVLWSNAEIQFLRDNRQMTDQQIADALDRGVSSVKSKRCNLSEHREYNCIVCKKRISQKGRYCKDCNWVERRISQSMYRAKQKGWEYNILEQDAIDLLKSGCVYCGEQGGGLDRVDSSKGYIVENTVSCCSKCNTMKMDMPLDEWFAHMRKILENCNG